MKKLILKLNDRYSVDDIERFEDELKKRIKTNGYAVIDDSVDIYEFDDGKIIVETN